MLDLIYDNKKSIREFVSYIRERIESSSKAWREIASAFAEAKEMYGGDSDRFRRLCKETNFSKGTAYKLAIVGSDERLRKYEKALSGVRSWTLLYQITTLSEDQFDALKQSVRIDWDNPKAIPSITHGTIATIKRGNESSPLRVYATIEIDAKAIEVDVFSGEEYDTLESHLRQIESVIPYTRVTRSNLIERTTGKYERDLFAAFEKLTRKAFSGVIEQALAKHPRRKGEKPVKRECRALGESKEELWSRFEEDKELAFAVFGAPFDEQYYIDEARSAIAAKYEELEKKVKQRDPFQYANNVTKSSGGTVNLVTDGSDRRTAQNLSAGSLKDDGSALVV